MRAFTSRPVSFLLAAAAFLIAAGALLAGCDSTAGSDEDATGSLRVMLTDAPFPFDRADSANVTIERVVALTTSDTTDAGEESEDAGRVVLSDETQSFNLLRLRDGVTAPLAADELPAGTYEQIRLILGEAASVVMDDGTTYDLQVPSGTQTGVKVLLSGLTVEPGTESELTLDFDVEESFVVKGSPDSPAGINGFLFKPTVNVKSMSE